jgi:hypothetical protein
MAPLETAITELRQILSVDSTAPEWRWNVRRRLSEVKDALSGPQVRQADAWLAARAQSSNRVRHQLHARATTLASGVLDKLDVESILQETRRLLSDLEHYVQRLHDLVYDSVSLELGGSE